MIYKDIINVINEVVNRSDTLVLRKSNVSAWEGTQKKIKLLPTQYLSENINYQELYYKEKMPFYEDISVILIKGGVAVGIWPLCLFIDNDDNMRIGTFSSSIVQPLLMDDYYCKPKTLRAIWHGCLEFIQECMRCLDIKECNFQQLITGSVDVWHKKLMECNISVKTVKHKLYRDLQMDDKEALKCLHRTTMQDIKAGKQLYDAEIITKHSTDISDKFDHFRRYHIQVAGRETRSIATWKIQEDNLLKSNDFLVMLYNKDTKELVGASLFVVANEVATYAVAAYDRGRFNTSVGHVAQDTAINHLKTIGIKWYEIGERLYANDLGADLKNLNIGLFKEKFATHMFCMMEVTFKGM